MSKKNLTLSIIIPVYNEEKRIAACLDSVKAQIEPPREVIVVDNNCTDSTVEIAKSYDFVKVVKEKTQGLIAARNHGLEIAKGDILCRIDADSRLSKGWTSAVRSAFEADNNVTGITGLATTDLLPRLPFGKTRLYSWGYFWLIGGYYRTKVLWGANMAIRRNTWQNIKGDVCLDDKTVHEDLDVTLCMLARGGSIKRIKGMHIYTDGQVYNHFPKLTEYLFRINKTLKLHKSKGSWPVREEVKYPLWQVVTRYAVGIFPASAFYIFSFVLWPIDLLLIKYTRSKGRLS